MNKTQAMELIKNTITGYLTVLETTLPLHNISVDTNNMETSTKTKYNTHNEYMLITLDVRINVDLPNDSRR